jgi:hypothetical protein
MNVKRRFLGAAIAAAVTYTAFPARASALPGQTIAQFTAWAAQRPQLRQMQRISDVLSGFPAFRLVTLSLSFVVRTDGRRVVFENLGVGEGHDEPGTQLIRRDGTGYGYAYLRSLYGPVVAGDYRTARRVAAFTFPPHDATIAFYRGKLYGYSVSGAFVTLETFAALALDIEQNRRCLATLDNCRQLR